MSNVLVYSGPGVSSSALQHTLGTLRRLLPSYDVQAVDARALACDPWAATTALLVLPGGRDLPYVASLGEAQRPPHAPASAAVRADERIHAYVSGGGRFLGICAGAYFASAQVVFQRDTPLEVVGARPALRFFPGECRGTAYPGFVYESDAGARLARLALPDGGAWTCAYNGGGAFLDAEAYAAQGVEVLARYPPADAALAPGYAGQAAAVRCAVGAGVALLFGTHPEFPLQRDARSVRESGAPETVPPTDAELRQLDEERLARLAALLRDTGLEATSPHVPSLDSAPLSQWGVPRLTPLFWLSSIPDGMGELLALQSSSARPALTDMPSLFGPDAPDDSGAPLAESFFLAQVDQNDTFILYSGVGTSRSITRAMAEADYSPYLEVVSSGAAGGSNGNEAEARAHDATEVNLHRVPKYVLAFPGVPDAAKGSLVATSSVLPDRNLTPHFDMVAAMRHLAAARERLTHGALASLKPKSGSGGWPVEEAEERIGHTIMYGEVVTSTQTLLDKCVHS
jgi:biotin--protein ligase